MAATASDSVQLEVRDGIAVITIDNPPVNALSRHVREGICNTVRAAVADSEVTGIVLACAGRTFIAGADITEFGKPLEPPGFLEMIDVLDDAPKPVVAAIHGTALGGGLETALACHFRVAVASARFGLPEVKLGLCPGAGGTQRLPRVVGPEKALEMIVGGNPIGAREALAHGLADEVVEGDLTEGAVAFARRAVAEGRPLVRIRDRDEKVAPARGNSALFDEFRKKHARRMRGFEAPEACIRTVEAAVERPFDEGMAREQAIFAELMAGVQARAQQYFFFSEREAAKIPDVPRGTETLDVKRAVVVGGGTMGGGISMCFANAGIPVSMVEMSQEALDRGLATIRRNYESTAARGGFTAEQVEERLGLIHGTLDLDAAREADVVVEAVFEELEVKQETFRRLDALAPAHAVLATNTSALDVNAIAAVTGRPESVIGTHFFSPANIMRLVEVVRGEKSANETIATAMALSRRLGKVPVLVGVCHGFVGNRMLFARQREAGRLILEGAPPEAVDAVLYDFGLPMGPFAMADLAGLDLGWNAETSTGSTIRERLCEAGRRGQKTGAGYYDYEPGNRTPKPSPVVARIIREFAEERQVRLRDDIGREEIFERLVYPMINEGAKILEEGIALRASDIDVVWVYGYGWPVYRGGPMFHADEIGVDRIVARLKELEASHGEEWRPAALLQRVAGEGGRIGAS